MDMPSDHGRLSDRLTPRVGFVTADHAQLYSRDVGAGQPIMVIHGEPDFDHQYLLPELDRLADAFRLIYYDQRRRGRSAEGVRADDVTIRSEVEDIECVPVDASNQTVTG
jgi:proline iminopeptidase